MFESFLQYARRHAEAWIVGVTVVFCTLVATVLTFLNGDIWGNYVASYSIGMTCMSFQLLAHKYRPESWSREWVTVITGVIGLALGLLLGGTLGAFDPFYFFETNPIGVVIGGIACIVAGFVILLIGHIRDLEAERDTAIQQELVSERELAITQLRTLQAQIEPHFLFNTLANVQALLDSEPSKARELLGSLTDLFRVSLNYARSNIGTVRMETDLISNYLDVQKMRMGDRLSFRIEVEDGLKDIQLPPFLVQPLVENAIKHGIEPSPEPGSIEVLIARKDDTLRIDVTNTLNPGFKAENSGGLGIPNVRERLRAVYGESAKLQIDDKATDRFSVTLQLPLEKAQV